MIYGTPGNESGSNVLTNYDKKNSQVATTDVTTEIQQDTEMSTTNALSGTYSQDKRDVVDRANKYLVTYFNTPRRYKDSTLKSFFPKFYKCSADATSLADGNIPDEDLLIELRNKKSAGVQENHHAKTIFQPASNLVKFEKFDSILTELSKYNFPNSEFVISFVLQNILNVFNANFISLCLRNENYLCKLKITGDKKSLNDRTENSGTSGIATAELSTSNKCRRPLDVNNGNKDGINEIIVLKDVENIGDNSSNFGGTWMNKNIEISLPATWDVVAAHNVITILDENDRKIRITLNGFAKTNFNRANWNLTRGKNSGKSAESIQRTNVQVSCFNRCLTKVKPKNSEYKTIFISNESIGRKNSNKNMIEHSKNCILPLKKPLLMKCMDGGKKREILMYKTHSLQNVYREKYSKTLEDLYKRSRLYDGEPIHIIFDPAKVIQNLKGGDKAVNGLICVHSSEAKDNLVKHFSVAENMPRRKMARNLNRTEITSLHMSRIPRMGKVRSLDSSTFEQRQTKWRKTSTVSCTYPDSTAMKSNGICTPKRDSVAEDNKTKLKIRKSRTAFKRVNVIKIVASVFRQFFHFYALARGHLKSGAVMTRTNSNYWLRVAGVVTDSSTMRLASDLFTTTAGPKVVMNIFDYLRFLIAFARTKRLIVAELVAKMMVHDKCSSFTSNFQAQAGTKTEPNNQTNDVGKEDGNLIEDQTLPDLPILVSDLYL